MVFFFNQTLQGTYWELFEWIGLLRIVPGAIWKNSIFFVRTPYLNTEWDFSPHGKYMSTSLGLALTIIKSGDWTLLSLTSRPWCDETVYNPTRSALHLRRLNERGSKNCRVIIPRQDANPLPPGDKICRPPWAPEVVHRGGGQLEVPCPTAGVDPDGRWYQTGIRTDHPVQPKEEPPHIMTNIYPHWSHPSNMNIDIPLVLWCSCLFQPLGWRCHSSQTYCCWTVVKSFDVAPHLSIIHPQYCFCDVTECIPHNVHKVKFCFHCPVMPMEITFMDNGRQAPKIWHLKIIKVPIFKTI